MKKSKARETRHQQAHPKAGATYSPRALFRDCIDSVVHLEGATEENFEAIFIDDGSSDGSAALLDDAAKDCPYMNLRS